MSPGRSPAAPAPRRRVGAVVLVVALAVALLVSACSSIPTSGKVETSSTTATAPPDQFIRVLARPPRPGATPTEIVAGFLDASASFDGDHAVARTYLTAAASVSWQPDVHVTVYDSVRGYSLADFGAHNVRMLALESAGDLTARGQFVQPTTTGGLRFDFPMSRVGGQWRIAVAPKGLILSTADVTRAYRIVNLYFLDVAGGTLVPDPVYLPTQQPGVATTVARELLLGPTAWLAPAVRTGFPAGTKLAVDSVPVQDGVARVDLEPRAVAASGDERRQLAAQLAYTLTQLPNVSGVRITLSGVPFTIPGAPQVNRPEDWPTFDPDLTTADQATYAIDDGHLAVVTTGADAVPGYFGSTRRMTQAAVALDGSLFAAAVRDGTKSVVHLSEPSTPTAQAVYTGRDITAMSFDRLGSVWFADTVTRSDGRRTSTLWITEANRRVVRVTVEGLGNRTVRAMKVSRDGARIALVLDGPAPGSGELLLGRVQRDADVPVVAGLRRVENALTGVEDVGWADADTLLVVGRRGSDPVQSFTVGIDGDSLTSAGAVPALRSVAASPGRPYLAGTTNDTLWVDRGSGWRVFVTGTTPIYPG